MHLALLTPEWYPDDSGGGIATYCRILATQAARLGHQITVLAGTISPGRSLEALFPNLRVVPVPVAGLPASAVAERFSDAWRQLVARGPRPDRVEAAEFGGVAALLSDTDPAPPLCTRLHTPLSLLLECNSGERIYPDDTDRCLLEARQVRASTLLTSPSAWLAGEAVRLWCLAEAPLVIPNPIGLDLPCGGSRGPRAPGPPRVLFFGRLEHRKGVLTLAEAAHRWLARGANAQITLVGTDTKWRGRPMSSLLQEALGPYARPPACRFLPAQHGSALEALIDAADLVVLPSLYENFPYACLESMARAKPVLATTGSGFEEIIDDGRTGFLIPPADPQLLAAALAERTADSHLLQALGARAQQAVTRFASDKIVPRLLAAYTDGA